MTKNEITLFAATWMDPEIIDKKQRENHISYDIPYIGNVKYDINELLQNRKRLKTQKTKYCYRSDNWGEG